MRYNQFICTLTLSLALAGSASAYSGGTGTVGDPYQIGDVNDWQQLMNTRTDWGKSFILTADIDFHGITLYSIGSFAGSLDGHGHVIRNVTMSGSNSKNGLFSDITTTGVVQGLGICDANITSNMGLGILCRQNHGTITGCHSAGLIEDLGPTGMTDESVGGLCGWNYGTIAASSSTAVVKGNRYAGGLCGRNSGTIVNCSANGTVRGYEGVGGLCGQNLGTIKSSLAGGEIIGSEEVGGLCGSNSSGTITNSGATGQVTGDSSSWAVGGLSGVNYHGVISRCYATGTVTGERFVGGLCGKPMYGSITDCYATGAVAGKTEVGGLCGYIGDAITRCYAAGRVTGNKYVGGLVGYRSGSVVTGSLWNVDTTGEPNAVGLGSPSGIYGCTDIEMKQIGTFASYSWDFIGESANGTNDHWRMCDDDVDYPRLTWEYVKNGDFACPDGVAFDDMARLASDWLVTYSTTLYGADATGDQSVNFADFARMAAIGCNRGKLKTNSEQ
jgi:hypothetical protein